LILAGDQDRQDPVEQHEREVLARIPGAKLVVIRNCGHLMPIDQPIELVHAIRSFVSQIHPRVAQLATDEWGNQKSGL
jgi:3-oxoadipate enol-lactonase